MLPCALEDNNDDGAAADAAAADAAVVDATDDCLVQSSLCCYRCYFGAIA